MLLCLDYSGMWDVKALQLNDHCRDSRKRVANNNSNSIRIRKLFESSTKANYYESMKPLSQSLHQISIKRPI